MIDRQSFKGFTACAVGQIDSKKFSESERRMVQAYRQMSNADRQMLRTLMDRLATIAAVDQGGAR